MPTKVAVIQFPGSNCEVETARAVRAAGAQCDIVRWNVSESEFGQYDGYILPGGFSYQDRIRAGAIAAKLPITVWLQKADQLGKPILGICNGCQILAETGIVPNASGQYLIEMALAPNERDAKSIGFICDWVYVTIANPKANVFTAHLPENTAIPIPINHGEGRFVFSNSAPPSDTSLHVRYCTSAGVIKAQFPINPNGATHNTAAISNTKGNVLAIMPHPERAATLKQMPSWMQNPWSTQKLMKSGYLKQGPWAPLFEAMASHIQQAKTQWT